MLVYKIFKNHFYVFCTIFKFKCSILFLFKNGHSFLGGTSVIKKEKRHPNHLRNFDGFDAFDKVRIALENGSFRVKELPHKGPWEWCIGIGKEDRELLKPLCEKLNAFMGNDLP